MSLWGDVLTESSANVDTASGAVLGLMSDGNPDELVASLFAVRSLRQKWASIEAALEAEVVAVCPGEGELPGVGAWEFRYGKKRTEWKHTDLAAEVTRRHLENSGGSFEPSELVAALLDVAAVAYWRTKKLKTLGVDVEDFCVSEKGRTTVQFAAGAVA